MKYGLCTIVLVHSLHLFYFSIHSKPFAHEWIHTHVITSNGSTCIENHELNLLLNFFYISYQRSCAILNLQEKALQMLQSVWSEWQLVTQLRRDPTHEYAFEMQLTAHVKSFIKQLCKTQQLCTNFTTLFQHLTKENTVSNKADEALQAVQLQEQIILAHTISELNQDIQTYAQSLTKGSSVLDFVWSCLPPLAIESFIKTDQMTMQIVQENWNLLYTLQELTNRNWTVLENVRAAFYYSLYKTIYETVNQHVNGAQFLTSFFKQNQSIPAPSCTSHIK
jgi:hypothetical protein